MMVTQSQRSCYIHAATYIPLARILLLVYNILFKIIAIFSNNPLV